MELSVKQTKFFPFQDSLNQKSVFVISRAVKYHFQKDDRISHTWRTWEFLYDLAHYDPEYKVRLSLWDIVNRLPTSISLSTVQRHIRLLVATGWLFIINTKTKYGTAPNIYKIGIPEHLMPEITRMQDRKFKVVPTVDYSCPPSQITPPLDRGGPPISADNKSYQVVDTYPSQDDTQIPQTIPFQRLVISDHPNISPKDNITNYTELPPIEYPEITFTEVVDAIRIELVSEDSSGEGEKRGEEKDPLQEAIQYVNKVCAEGHYGSTSEQVINTLEATLANAGQEEKSASKAFDDAAGGDKFRAMRTMQDKSAFTYQIKTQLENFKRMADRIAANRVSVQQEDGKLGAPGLCFTEEDFNALHQKLKKLRIKVVDIKKIMIEVIWSICFGSFKICKRTGRDNTTEQGRRDCIEAAVYLICVGKWSTPKGMIH
jgi:hypothetical protein